MRDRIPFVFAALLVAALIAVVGIAAFSINSSDDPPQAEAYDGVISGRVASAVLAVSVSTAGTEALQPLPTAETETVDAATTTQAPNSTFAPSTTSGADTIAPDIAVTSPEDGATVSNSVVEFAGTSEAGASVSSGPYAANTAADGSWTIKLVVSSGYNSTVFTAADAAGNESSARIVVYFQPPTTTTRPPSTTTTTHAHPPSTTPTTHVHPPSTTTTTTPKPPPSNCPVSGSCSSQWPADSAGARGGEAWRSVVAQYWPAERVQCVVDLIQRESSGNPQARNPNGGYLGLLQHSPWAWNARARAIGLVDGNGITAHPYNGAANIAAGAWLANNSSPWWGPWPPTKTISSCQALGAG